MYICVYILDIRKFKNTYIYSQVYLKAVSLRALHFVL